MEDLKLMVDGGKFAADFLTRNAPALKEAWGVIQVKTKIKMNKKTYQKYLEKSCNHYALVKPSIFGSEPIPIYDFFVPLNVKLGEDELIESVDYQNLVGMLPKHRAVISGTAGGGKSMLMRHLFISAQKTGKHVPVFVELRKANNDKAPLKSLIADVLRLYGLDLGDNQISFVEEALKQGHFALFLDGYDEVDLDHKQKLTKELLSISVEAPKCVIVLSTRPDQVTQGWEGFSCFNLQPLDKVQALHVVDKLPYEAAVKERFSKELDAHLYNKHREFTSIPLLLSIMLVSYSRTANIPDNLSEFYSQAFEALFHHHDASKEVYKRKHQAALGIQNFRKLFSAFCIRTYVHSKYEFTLTEVLDHIEKAKIAVNIEVKNEDFLEDMRSSVCLLVLDGLTYTFSHRSFQEYFSAVYIISCEPEKQRGLLDRVYDRWRGDKVIPLLNELSPEVVERELMLPQLAYLFDNIGVKKKIGISHYSKFIKHQIYSFSSNNVKIIDESDIEIEVLYVSHDVEVYCKKSLELLPFMSHFHVVVEGSISDCVKIMKDHLENNSIDFVEMKYISYKSSLIKELSESDSFLSLSSLNELWEEKKRLEKKYKNPIKNLDELLG